MDRKTVERMAGASRILLDALNRAADARETEEAPQHNAEYIKKQLELAYSQALIIAEIAHREYVKLLV
jgi:hypothetical protein